MSDEILKPTFTVKVGEEGHEEEFVLRVPTPLEKARLGVREAAIRRVFDPSGTVTADQLDPDTFFLIRGMAVLEVLLEKASEKWVWTEFKPDRGEPRLVVDLANIPIGKETVVMEVGMRFQEALDRFHRDRTEHTSSAVSQAVDGGGNTGTL